MIFKIFKRKVKCRISAILVLFLLPIGAMAQELAVHGKVSSADDNLPLPAVTVIIKGTTNGVITDHNGKYTLAKVPGSATLVFSFVGMKS